MDNQRYTETMERKLETPYVVRLKGDRSGKANLRQEAKLYELVDGVLKRGGLPVLREADMEAEVEKIHG